MNQINTVVLAIFIALGVTLVAGLVAMPLIEQAFANNGNHFGQVRNGNSGHHNGHGINT
jgi:hypothetical protein